MAIIGNIPYFQTNPNAGGSTMCYQKMKTNMVLPRFEFAEVCGSLSGKILSRSPLLMIQSLLALSLKLCIYNYFNCVYLCLFSKSWKCCLNTEFEFEVVTKDDWPLFVSFGPSCSSSLVPQLNSTRLSVRSSKTRLSLKETVSWIQLKNIYI